MKVRNFLFHRVSPQKDIMWPPIHPAHFEKIIRFLSKNYQMVLLESFLQTTDPENNDKPVATVSFDDGYKDNLEFAAPILQKYKCPASFYVVTDCINENIPTWTYAVDFFFRECPKKSLILEYDFVPADFRVCQWQFEEQGKLVSAKMKSWLKSLSNDHRLVVMDEIKKQLNDVEFPKELMMNWNNVRQLHSAGFYIGSHSHTHPMLASMAKEEEIEKELQQSAAIIKTQLGYCPISISYPIGSWDERVVRLAKKSGYQFGLAVEQTEYNTEKNDKLIIPRMELYSEPWWKTRLRISGVYQSVKKLFQ
jgi:peptidoglycan/xylan/chitin deacetylase (PgdA/CDA1 family)